MDRRDMIKVTGLGVAGFATGTAFTAPACDGVSKDKAVRYTGLVIDLMKDTAPLFRLLGANDLAQMVLDKAVPALEKLKEALQKTDIPSAGNLFDTVTGILGQIGNALFQLPESARRNTILGIVTAVNVMLRTVDLFVDAETPAAPSDAVVRKSAGKARGATSADAILKAFEATRF